MERHVAVNELLRMLLVWSSAWEAKAWPRRGEVDVVLTAGPGRAGLAGMRIVQSYLQTTLALLFIVPVSRLLFLPAVTSEKRESNRNSGLKLVGFKPFKMLVGATTPVYHPCVLKRISIPK